MDASDRRAPRARRHPGRRAVRAPLAVRRHLPAAAHRRPCRRPRAGPAAAPDRQPGRACRDPATTPRSPWRSPTTASKALGVPQASLDSFAPEFREGMAARAAMLGDIGESGPDHWEQPLGTHRRARRHRGPLPRRRPARRGRREGARRPTPSCRHRADLASGLLPARHRTDLVRVQGRHRPARGRGQRPAPTNPRERPLKAGEIILGYPTRPASCRRCRPRTCWVATAPTSSSASCTRRWRPTGSYLRDRAADRAEEDLLGAKMVGRWQSGAPLALAPDQDDPELGADPRRNNDFHFADDPRGFKCPVGAHARRANPRDALDEDGSVDVRLHRMIRRGTSYGPMLPDGVLEDDGVDRGIIFVFAGAHLKRQFEFVKTQWLNDGIFIGAPLEKDPLVGPHDDSSSFTIPQRPIRRRLQDLPPFVVTRGGEYCFAPEPERAALARRAGHLTTRHHERGTHDELIQHGPLGGTRLRPTGRRRRGDRAAGAPRLPRRRSGRPGHAQPTARRQRDHHRDGRPADRGRRDDRGPHRRPGRRPDRRRRPGLLRRQRPAAAQDHDQGGLAAPAPGLRPHPVHGAAAAQADLRRRQRHRLRRRLRARPEHRLHHRLRHRDLRPARGDARPGRRRRLTGAAAAPAAPRQGPADADDRRPGPGPGGLPARHGQRAPRTRPS